MKVRLGSSIYPMDNRGSPAKADAGWGGGACSHLPNHWYPPFRPCTRPPCKCPQPAEHHLLMGCGILTSVRATDQIL